MTHLPPAAIPGPHVLIAQDRTGAWTWTCKAATGACYSGRSGLNEATATAEGRAHADSHGVRVMKLAYEGPVDTGHGPTYADVPVDITAIDRAVINDLLYLADVNGWATTTGALQTDLATVTGWVRSGHVPAGVLSRLLAVAGRKAGWSFHPDGATATVLAAA